MMQYSLFIGDNEHQVPIMLGNVWSCSVCSGTNRTERTLCEFCAAPSPQRPTQQLARVRSRLSLISQSVIMI
jgi:hypothetical protein